MGNEGFWTGLNQATGTALATGMKLMDYAGDQRHRAAVEANQAAQLQIAKDKAEMEKTAFKYAEQDRQVKEKQLNAFVPVSAVAPNVHQLPETKKFYIQTLKDAGHEVKETPDGEIYITNRGINYLKELTTTKTEFGKVQLDNILTDLQGQGVAIGQQIAQIQESGKTDEKTLAPLQQKQMAIKMQIANVIGSQRDVMAKILEEQAKAKETKLITGIGPGGRPTRVPDVQGAPVYEKPERPVRVQLDVSGLQKPTVTKLEDAIIDADNQVAQFNEALPMFKPEYLEYWGKGKAEYQKYAEKAGISIDTKFLKERTAWYQQSKSQFLAYRKWITGVAGGEKEMKEIAKSFPDPDNNSPTEYKANLVQARKWTMKLRNRLMLLRGLGIDKPTKEDLKRFPLDSIPEVLPKTSQKSSVQEMSTEDLLKMLGGE